MSGTHQRKVEGGGSHPASAERADLSARSSLAGFAGHVPPSSVELVLGSAVARFASTAQIVLSGAPTFPALGTLGRKGATFPDAGQAPQISRQAEFETMLRRWNACFGEVGGAWWGDESGSRYQQARLASSTGLGLVHK